jgi:hypothetical protein
MKFTLPFTATVLSIAGLCAIGHASAQTPPSALPEAAAPSTAAVDDVKITQFADAYIAVQAIQQDAASRTQSDSVTPDSAAMADTTTQQRMLEAVQKNGLQPDEFNRIAQQVTVDPELRAKVAEKVQQRRGT